MGEQQHTHITLWQVDLSYDGDMLIESVIGALPTDISSNNAQKTLLV